MKLMNFNKKLKFVKKILKIFNLKRLLKMKFHLNVFNQIKYKILIFLKIEIKKLINLINRFKV